MNENIDFKFCMERRFKVYKPRILPQNGRYAAVLVPVLNEPEPSILLTLRASHLKSHPGQVSFPGGMYEPSDLDITQTALRETHEEIALPPDRFNVLGELSTVFSKDGVRVYPVVAVAEHLDGCLANPDEIADIFRVPWNFFKTEVPEFQHIERHNLSYEIPHFYFEGKHIWGLTAMIVLELLNVMEGMSYPLPDYSKIR